ncbi:hypothetical protein [Frankia sp. AgKG'84/4]|uniref:hypothetical protein n=1 Tax=Frankia sp. AgKG'84/4 TaxID=573490 RepID=UPI00200C74FF|nr:hypothetical protein [Frankia sp. AgKG'84/4]MCL9794751.1 hypothetical protein [Frankia sp. AgKG'84/4]
MVAEEFNLMLAERPENVLVAPGRPAIPHGEVQISGRTANLMYHHIVPFATLKNFWNTLVGSGGLKGCSFLPLLWEKISKRQYSDMLHAVGGRLYDNDLRDVADLAIRLYEGTVIHGESALRPTGWDNLTGVYAWLPGNLFVGPQNRLDDPKDSFDQAAVRVLQGAREKRCKDLSDANGKLLAYLGSAPGNRPTVPATAALYKVAGYLRTEPYDGSYWTWNKDKDKPWLRS